MVHFIIRDLENFRYVACTIATITVLPIFEKIQIYLSFTKSNEVLSRKNQDAKSNIRSYDGDDN